jgi:FkbM family methyltransferase
MPWSDFDPRDIKRYSGRSPDAAQMGLLRKVATLIRTVVNWPMVFVDKARLRKAVTYRMRSGAKFICRAGTPDINEVVAICSGFEYPAIVIGHVPRGAVVIDVGANIGSFSVFFARQHRDIAIRGWSVEPYSENVSLLRQNLALNAVPFTVAELAISDHNGDCRIETSSSPDAISVTADGLGDVVNCERLSTFCIDRQIDYVDLLKMDVEGHEYAIFASDSAFICARVSRIVLEWHHRPYGSRADIVGLFEGAFEITDVHRYPDRGVLLMENRSGVHPLTGAREHRAKE